MIYNCMPQCHGCKHRVGYYDNSDAVCDWYMRPAAKWGKLGGCEGATHVKRTAEETPKQRVGQQKQKKR